MPSFHPMQWYYAVGGQRLGPVSQAGYEQLVREGVIKPDTLVWRQGMSAWQPQSSVAGELPTGGVESPGGMAATGAEGGGDDTEVCSVSGKRYPKREMIQFEGQWISAEHRDAFFQRMREGVAQPGRFVYGGFWRRFVAKFIDGIILGLAGVVANMGLGVLLYGTANYFRPDTTTIPPTTLVLFQGLSMLIGIVLGLIYALFFIRKYSATPGKMAMGLKLVRADGSSLSVGRIIGRHFAEWISGIILLIGYIMAAFDDEKRALHDRICDTRVIKLR